MLVIKLREVSTKLVGGQMYHLGLRFATCHQIVILGETFPAARCPYVWEVFHGPPRQSHRFSPFPLKP